MSSINFYSNIIVLDSWLCLFCIVRKPNGVDLMTKPVYAICEQQRHLSDCTNAVHCLDSIIPIVSTVMILSFQTDMPGQTVQTQIRLHLEEQSDRGLHCLPFRLHHLDSLFYGRAT